MRESQRQPVTIEMISGLFNRARIVLRRSADEEIEVSDVAGEVYVLPPIYQIICHTFDIENFVMCRPNMARLKEHCNMEYLEDVRHLPEEVVNQPMLLLPDGTVLDGCHRALCRLQAGETMIPAYRLTEEVMEIIKLHSEEVKLQQKILH